MAEQITKVPLYTRKGIVGFALIDPEDAGRVTALGRWGIRRKPRKTVGELLYAVKQYKRDGKAVCVYLHHFVLGGESNNLVDHINPRFP